MPSSEAQVTTEAPARYLGQLCTHFAHRLPVTQEEGHGSITFPFGTCMLEATGEQLVLRASAADDAALLQLQEVIARHLLRFAFRAPPAILWTPAPAD